MPDPLDDLAAAARRVSPAWSAGREGAVRERLERALERRRTTRTVAALAAGALFVVAAGAGLGRLLAPDAAPSARLPALAPPAELLALEDGSKVRAASSDARVTPVEVGPNATLIRLDAGKAHFDVTPHEARRFRVVARELEVSVLGTAFDVALESDAVRVGVERGRVEVRCRGERRELGAGEAMRCLNAASVSSAPAAPLTPAEDTLPSGAAPGPNAAARPSAKAPTSWRALAQDGDYRAAFARMAADGPSAVRDDPGDLLFAADVARLSNHPDVAVERLERVVRSHAGDSRAPLAAFTLGRTLLDALGQPREAAEAFAKARRFAPSGALAQDALAREVESWSRAGEARTARDRARDYLSLYPGGRREKAVRYHGGLE